MLPLGGTVFSSQTAGSHLTINIPGDQLRKELDSSINNNRAWRNLAIVDAKVSLPHLDILAGDTSPQLNWNLFSESLWVENGEVEVGVKAHFSQGITLKNSALTGLTGGSNDVLTPVIHSYGDSSITNNEIQFTANAAGTGIYVHDGHLKIRDDIRATSTNFELGISSGAIFEIVATSTVDFTIDNGIVNNAGTIKMHGSGPSLQLDAPVTFNHSGDLDIAFNSILDVDGSFNFKGGSIKNNGGSINIATFNVEGDGYIEHRHLGGGTGLTIEQLNVNNGHLLIT